MTISRSEALATAKQDAVRAYHNLEHYEVSIKLISGNWHIDYELIDPALQGGGPHYVISGSTGEVLSKHYEQ